VFEGPLRPRDPSVIELGGAEYPASRGRVWSDESERKKPSPGEVGFIVGWESRKGAAPQGRRTPIHSPAAVPKPATSRCPGFKEIKRRSRGGLTGSTDVRGDWRGVEKLSNENGGTRSLHYEADIRQAVRLAFRVGFSRPAAMGNSSEGEPRARTKGWKRLHWGEPAPGDLEVDCAGRAGREQDVEKPAKWRIPRET